MLMNAVESVNLKAHTPGTIDYNNFYSKNCPNSGLTKKPMDFLRVGKSEISVLLRIQAHTN